MTIVRVEAPGRVNLIGDHTDYTGGLVLPMVLEQSTFIEGEAIDGDTISIESADERGVVEFDRHVDDPSRVEPSWGRYVAAMVREAGNVPAFRARITTTLPIGSGLSSSAALEIAIGRFIRDLTGRGWDDVAMAEAARRAEHAASGVPCGIMDQLCIAVGRQREGTFIDCRDLTFRHIALPEHADIVVRFVAHRTLVGSEYAARVADCRAIESLIGPLRDATPDDVASISDERLRRRARHVTSENQRVLESVRALEAGDLTMLGCLMMESHASLARDYETSTPTMDRAVEELMAEPGVLGARMTGGGFGGCVVAIRSAE
jgi:galactokinase